MDKCNLIISLSLYQGHLKSSKKTLIISTIGLIIALSLVSSSLYYLDNSRHQLILTSFSKGENSGNDVVINLQNDYTNTSPNLSSINTAISQIITKYD